MIGRVPLRIFALCCLGAGATVFAGCGRSDSKDGKGAASAPAVSVTPSGPASKPSPPADPSLTPFMDAVLLEAPDNQNRPPDQTASGKSSAKLFEMIAGHGGKGGLWEQVRLTGADGKRLRPHALLRTEAGDIKIELLADAAPNHVRSFICLAKAGYFDGLPFHASIRREGKEMLVGYLESGCPKGTGEAGYGSIGYWLKPEIDKNLVHEEGTVGAWHPEELEGAACRFYITLNKSPGMDGSYTIFGKIVEGLDVAHTINKRPIQDAEYTGPPQMPYRIREAVILE